MLIMISLIVTIPPICSAVGIEFPRDPCAKYLGAFVAAEIIAWVCWGAIQLRRPWSRWHTLLCFFTSIASSFGAGLICDFWGKSEISGIVVMFVGMLSKAAGSYFLFEREFAVRLQLPTVIIYYRNARMAVFVYMYMPCSRSLMSEFSCLPLCCALLDLISQIASTPRWFCSTSTCLSLRRSSSWCR